MKRETFLKSSWRVIIVGGGFGGLGAARALKSDSFDVTLIDRRNYHLYQPLLNQIDTGSLGPGQISAPLRNLLSKQKNTRVVLGSVEDVDPGAKQVFLADGAVLAYDSLIVATGAQPSYFGNDDWQQWAPGLKGIRPCANAPRFPRRDRNEDCCHADQNRRMATQNSLPSRSSLGRE